MFSKVLWRGVTLYYEYVIVVFITETGPVVVVANGCLPTNRPALPRRHPPV